MTVPGSSGELSLSETIFFLTQCKHVANALVMLKHKNEVLTGCGLQ